MSKKLLHPLEALSHLDGRNADKIQILRNYFSDFSRMKLRLQMKVHHLIFLFQKKTTLQVESYVIY